MGAPLQEIVKVKRKFNVTIPKKLRKNLPVKVGQLVKIKLEDGKLVLKPIAEDPSGRLEEIIGKIRPEDIARQAEEVIVKEAKSRLAKKIGQR